MKTLLALLLLMLTGCAAFTPPTYAIKSDMQLVSITLTEDLPAGINGHADWSGPVCVVKLRKSHYPRCIQHEVDHCFRGAWHGRMPNSDQCWEQ